MWYSVHLGENEQLACVVTEACIRAAGAEQLDHVGVLIELLRQMQGRAAGWGSCGEIGAAVEQESEHGGGLVEPRRLMQGREADLGSCGEIGAAVEQESEHGGGSG